MHAKPRHDNPFIQRNQQLSGYRVIHHHPGPGFPWRDFPGPEIFCERSLDTWRAP